MLPKRIFFILFSLMCLVQWLVPTTLVFRQQDALVSGSVFKFKTMPIDPVDFFRGRFIQLRFEENTVPLDTSKHWTSGENVFALLTTNEEGFAHISAISKEKPDNNDNYISVTLDYIYRDSTTRGVLALPFEKYYMQEDKAPVAESVINKVFQDSVTIVYALVRVKKGVSSLEDIMIDDKSLHELLDTVPRQ